MIPFTKAHANGNDFLILDEADVRGDHAQLARALCARTTGIGADGIEFLDLRTDPTHASLRLFNADGSEAELSGNGTRCVAAYLAHKEALTDITFHTAAGPRHCRVLTSSAPHFTIETSMGVPRITPLTVTLPDLPPLSGLSVDLGNPHFVLFPETEDFSLHNLAWQELGARLTNHPAFPHGTNIEFVRPLAPASNPTEIAFRIFERGCGPTTSSGTGTSASAAAAIHALGASRSLTVHAEGGPQQVLWPAADAELLLTGPAELLCSGEAFPAMTAPGQRHRTRPRALRPGSTLAIISPASAAKPDRVHAGIARLHQLGYATVLGQHALATGPLYYAGTLAQRLDDLHAAFANPAVDAILCTRGGWGSAELLPHLDLDLIRANPKPFLGYSDHTSLHIWLANEADLVTFYAPMVSPDFAESGGIDPHSWSASLSGKHPWSLDPEMRSRPSLRTLRSGSLGSPATGILHGGCLAILAESLGTPFAPRDHAGILFLEDVNVRPFQWDRMLLHLRLAGQLEGVTGIVLGDMQQSAPPEEQALLEAAILHALRDFSGPIVIGLRSGHVTGGNVTLPLGVRVQLDCTDPANPAMHFLEAATTT